jgi:replicative DNA helicase
MKLSAPIYRLKREARLLSREKNIPLHAALDQLAAQEGFKSWSLLAAHASETSPSKLLLDQLQPAEMVLLGARSGQGKTLLGMELIAEAVNQGRPGVFFTLEYTADQVRGHFSDLGLDASSPDGLFDFDNSDEICATRIMERLAHAPAGCVAVIDYLQLLDQKRENPDLMQQVADLKQFARDRGLIFVFISQISRTFDPALKRCPDVDDVRLPNPLDLSLFTRTCFMHEGEVQVSEAA